MNGPLSSLPAESQRVLRVMVRRPVISGGELAVLANLSADNLTTAVRPLLSAGIISTDTLDSEDVFRSYFNLNPSARGLAEYAAR